MLNVTRSICIKGKFAKFLVITNRDEVAWLIVLAMKVVDIEDMVALTSIIHDIKHMIRVVGGCEVEELHDFAFQGTPPLFHAIIIFSSHILQWVVGLRLRILQVLVFLSQKFLHDVS